MAAGKMERSLRRECSVERLEADETGKQKLTKQQRHKEQIFPRTMMMLRQKQDRTRLYEPCLELTMQTPALSVLMESSRQKRKHVTSLLLVRFTACTFGHGAAVSSELLC